MKTSAKVRFRREGLQHYPSAEGDEEFLKHEHRHMFHFKVLVEQFHDNRDVEYIRLKRFLTDNFEAGDFDNQSCEMIAKDVVELVESEFGSDREVVVEVTEDGENGAVVESP